MCGMQQDIAVAGAALYPQNYRTSVLTRFMINAPGNAGVVAAGQSMREAIGLRRDFVE
jgi:hypothetical protein